MPLDSPQTSGMYVVAVLGGVIAMAVNLATLVKVFVLDKERLIKLETNADNMKESHLLARQELKAEIKDLQKEREEAHNNLATKMEDNFKELSNDLRNLSENIVQLNTILTKRPVSQRTKK